MLYALLGAVAIGLVLGLLGSGGSILTVPVLVYLAGHPDKVAIAESLAIVGAVASVGAVSYTRQGLVDWRSVLGFGVPGIAGTYAGAVLAAHVPGAVQLVLFGVVMIAAAGAMLKGRGGLEGEPASKPAWAVALLGASVGVLTGLVGVGGGFLIVPALVLLVGLDMRLAVGTSLSIIVLNSATGFLKYLDVLADAGGAVDWRLVATFAVIGIAGSLVGSRLGQRVPQARLRRGFAAFLVVMGVFILYKEAPAAFAPAEAAAAPLALPPDTADVRRLSPAEAVAYLAATPEAQVLDVRTPGEFAGGHLAGAVNVDVMAPDLRQRVEPLDLPAGGPVYLYCRSDNRSGQAAGVLRAMGHAGAVNVGGLDALVRAGAETA